MNLIKHSTIALALTAILSGRADAQTATVFTPGKLAVLQEGDGGAGRCLPAGAKSGITYYTPSDLTGSRQNQYFIDQFDPNTPNQTVPSVYLPVPTNDAAGGIFVNGNAGTEGGMTLAGDKSVLTFAGYTGTILSITTGGQTAPSNLSYNRGIATVDAFTNYTRVYSGPGWYGIATGKTNPRGVTTDGLGGFWGCGNGYGSLYYDANTPANPPIPFQNVNLTSTVKVLNNAVYAAVKAGDVQNGLYPAGIYSFVDDYYNPVPYPNYTTFLQLLIKAQAPWTNCIGFDINPQGTVAYVGDVGDQKTEWGGLQKYVKQGNNWVLAYNLSIPGYYGQQSGILTNASSTNVLAGIFSVTVDWTGTNPVVYATTTDGGIDSGDVYYGNRVLRINDTNTVVSGANIIVTTNLNLITTLVHPPLTTQAGYNTTNVYGTNITQLTNVVYKSVTFTPDIRPIITSNPANWSAAPGDAVSFSVTATSAYGAGLGYQWLSNGVPVNAAANLSAGTATLTFPAVDLSYNNALIQCEVTNVYGAVTSSVATLLVGPASQPTLGAVQQLTNYIGNAVTINVNAGGTYPQTYQWYFNGNPITDGPSAGGGTYVGTQTASLTVDNTQAGDSGAFSVGVTNAYGGASGVVANLDNVYAAPSVVVPPSATTTFYGQSVSFTVSAYDGTVNGTSLAYQWYSNTSSKTNNPAPHPLTGGEYTGTQTATLTVNGATAVDATNYVVVVSNSGGSVTSAPVALTLLVQPLHGFLSLTNIGTVYQQNFDSLPINGGGSANAANPNVILVVSNSLVGNNTSDPGLVGASVTYSLNNPYDFTYPIIGQGSVGGLGLTSLNGWYGWSSSKLQFGATYGDETAGGILDNGQNYLGNGAPLNNITNRALGLIATTKSGYVAFGLALINNTTSTINYINVGFTGELWCNNPSQQVLGFSYAIDPAGSNTVFNPGTPEVAGSLNLNTVPGLNVAFPTSTQTAILDGTQSTNQLTLATNGLAVTGWTPGTALWLVWESQNPIGGAQDVAIDNLTFSSSLTDLPVTAPTLGGVTYNSSTGLSFTFTNTAGAATQFTTWSTTNLTLPFSQWVNLGNPTEVSPGNYEVTDRKATASKQTFYKVTSP